MKSWESLGQGRNHQMIQRPPVYDSTNDFYLKALYSIRMIDIHDRCTVCLSKNNILFVMIYSSSTQKLPAQEYSIHHYEEYKLPLNTSEQNRDGIVILETATLLRLPLSLLLCCQHERTWRRWNRYNYQIALRNRISPFLDENNEVFLWIRFATIPSSYFVIRTKTRNSNTLAREIYLFIQSRW